MRRVGVIVALGVLLGVVGGPVTTSSALAGAAKVSLTNPANGNTVTANISGPIKEIDSPDGSVTFVGKGHQFNLLEPADAARFGLPGFFVSVGGLTLAVAADGTITSLTMDGHVLVDLCAALG